MQLTLAHLYPEEMNIYGDRGNVAVLAYRCRQRGIDINIKNIGLNASLPLGSFDLLFGGGGQDRQQQLITRDLLSRQKVLSQAAANHIPMLTICGTYQLFGRYFQPFSGLKMTGIGIFNAYTVASKQRKIGNAIINSQVGDLVGFENHSGNTYLSGQTRPLGQVIVGFGNNGSDKSEGAVINNVFGTYLHGPFLPKNPHFADYLLKLALENKYGPMQLTKLNDSLEWQTHKAAVKRTKKLKSFLLKYFTQPGC